MFVSVQAAWSWTCIMDMDIQQEYAVNMNMTIDIHLDTDTDIDMDYYWTCKLGRTVITRNFVSTYSRSFCEIMTA